MTSGQTGRSAGGRRAERRAGGATLLLALLLTGCTGGEDASEPASSADDRSDAAPSDVSTADASSGNEVSAPPVAGGWTTGSARTEHQPAGSVTVSDVRAASHDGFDRFVIVLAGDDLPGHTAELGNGPAIQCGSGDPIVLPGEAVLTFRMDPARAHDDSGSSTLAVRDLRPGLPALLEARMTCDFEGHVEWAFGIADATGFRVLELTDPTRIAIDIQH